jgi:hypothetical protein
MRFAARFVLCGNIDRDFAFVVDIESLDDKRFGIFRIDFSKHFASDTGIEELGFLGVNDELLSPFPRERLRLFCVLRGHVLRTDDEIVIGIERRIFTLSVP